VLPLAQPYPWTTTVLVDEIDVGQRPSQTSKRRPIGTLTPRGTVAIASLLGCLDGFAPDYFRRRDLDEPDARLVAIGELDAGRLKCPL